MNIISENRNFFILAFCLMLGTGSTHAQALFELIYGTTAYDEVQDVTTTADSGYVILGSTSAAGNGSTDVFLLKLSSTGSWVWQRYLGGFGIEKGNAIVQTADSGFAIAGFTNTNGSYDALLLKTDKDGQTLWSKEFGGSDWDFANDIAIDPSGNLYMIGSTYSSGAGNEDVYMIKCDASGNLLWEKTFGGSADDRGTSLTLDKSSFICATGTTKSFDDTLNNIYVFRCDNFGNFLWERSYGGMGDDEGNDIIADADGGFIIAGVTNSFTSMVYDEIWILKIDAAGDTTSTWTRRYGAAHNRHTASIDRAADGGLILSGILDANGSDDLFLLKTDMDGWYENFKVFGGSKNEIPCAAKATPDSGFILVGGTESYGGGLPNIYVVKTGADLISSGTVITLVGTEEWEANELPIHIYPNPASETLFIDLNADAVINIIDATGRTIHSQRAEAGNSSVSLYNIPTGLYFINVKDKSSIRNAKLFIRR